MLPRRFSIILLICLPAFTGCAATPPIVELTWTGTLVPPEIIDDSVASHAALKLMMQPNVQGITTISTDSNVDVYITGVPHADGNDLLQSSKDAARQLARDLPPFAYLSQSRLLPASEKIPVVTPHLVDRIQVVVDRNKASAAGVSNWDIQLLSNPGYMIYPDEQNIQLLNSVRMTGDHGTSVMLGSIATITLVQKPDTVVHTYP